MVQKLTNKLWMNIRKNAKKKKKFISSCNGCLKLGVASKHFKTLLLTLLACCDTDIRNIEHSRKNMDKYNLPHRKSG